MRKKYNACFIQLYSYYKRNCAARKTKFKLSKVKFEELIKGNCYYCGKEPSSILSKASSKLFYNGIDRISPNASYNNSNCVSCCKTCNFMKGLLGAAEFIAAVKAIFRHQENGHKPGGFWYE